MEERVLEQRNVAFLWDTRGSQVAEGKCQPMQQRQEMGFNPRVRKVTRSREWHPTAVFLLGKSHGQRNGRLPSWGRKECDTTEPLRTRAHARPQPCWPSQGISRRPRTERAKPEARVSPSYRCGWTEMKTSSTGFITRTCLKCLCCALDRPWLCL